MKHRRRFPAPVFVVLGLAVTACGGSPPTVASATAGGGRAGAGQPASSSLATPAALSGEPAREDDAIVPIGSDDATWGSRLAPVTIVEFADFQCPFCARVAPTIEQLKIAYGPETLRVVWKNEPLSFHPYAQKTAEVAQGVLAIGGPQAFWRYYDIVFQRQTSLNDDVVVDWAREVGVPGAVITAGLARGQWKTKVAKDADVAQANGLVGTPSFLVNGTAVVGAQPLEKFKAVVDDELAKAKTKIATGTPVDRVYAVTSAENLAREKAERAARGGDDDDRGPPPPPDTTIYKVPVAGAPVRGKATALITVVEFADFQCPYCKRSEETVKALEQKYGADLRVVWKNNPLSFHPRAEPTAELALEARAEKGDKAFWDVHDKLFARQPQLEDGDLDAVAKDAGLDAAKVRAAIAGHKFKKSIDADQDLADELEARGTPTFFVNGRVLVGALPVDRFTTVIDEEMARARAQLAKGTSPAALYDALIKDGKRGVEPEKKTVAAAPNAPARGPASAKVTITEFSDFQCPFCKRAEDTLTEVTKNYGTKVRIVWRQMPLGFHADASLAAQASVEAYAQKGATGFWHMHDLLFAGQGQPDGLKRAALDGYAKEIGLDMKKWAAALDGETHKAEVDADAKAGAAAGITGTPGFVVNGYYISGAQPYAKFRRVIERALAESGGATAAPR